LSVRIAFWRHPPPWQWNQWTQNCIEFATRQERINSQNVTWIQRFRSHSVFLIRRTIHFWVISWRAENFLIHILPKPRPIRRHNTVSRFGLLIFHTTQRHFNPLSTLTVSICDSRYVTDRRWRRHNSNDCVNHHRTLVLDGCLNLNNCWIDRNGCSFNGIW
jgi:hypothetical protein